jgi:hypothetical protein
LGHRRVVGAGRVVDAVAASPRSAPFEAHELGCEARQIEKFDVTGIEQGQEVAVDVGLGLLGGNVLDSMHTKPFARPFAAISIARDEVLHCGRGAAIRHERLLSPREMARYEGMLRPNRGSTSVTSADG